MQRKNSYFKKLKTERPITGYLAQNIANALTPNNKSLIAKRQFRLQSNKENMPFLNDTKKSQKPKQVKMIELQNMQVSSKCINHPKKVALFQLRQQNCDSTYCQQCAIDLVKQNKKMSKIDPKKQFLKQLMKEQLKNLTQSYQNITVCLKEHFESYKKSIKGCFQSILNQTKITNKINLEIIKVNSSLQKNFRIETLLGKLQKQTFIIKEYKFSQEKQENHCPMQSIASFQHSYQRINTLFDMQINLDMTNRHFNREQQERNIKNIMKSKIDKIHLFKTKEFSEN